MHLYLSRMDRKGITLSVLYNIVKGETQPVQYRCTVREMVLHSIFEWELIAKHLELLEADGLVEIHHGEPICFSITAKGIAYLQVTIKEETIRSNIIFKETIPDQSSL